MKTAKEIPNLTPKKRQEVVCLGGPQRGAERRRVLDGERISGQRRNRRTATAPEIRAGATGKPYPHFAVENRKTSGQGAIALSAA